MSLVSLTVATIMGLASRTLFWLEDLIFPISCVGCGEEGIWLCAECLKKIGRNQNCRCLICNRADHETAVCQHCRGKSDLDGAMIYGDYDDNILGAAIHGLKYKYVKNLAECLYPLLFKILNQEMLGERTIITGVPLHPRRERMRDFNQAYLLARPVADNFQLDFYPGLIRRRRFTTSQMTLSREERLKNLASAFELMSGREKIIENKKIILVDDVLTTGSTLQECARVLKAVGAQEVWGLVLARGK